MIVELVKLGFLGFATAILVFSYTLLQRIMGSKDFEGDNLLIRCKEIRIFMAVSILVILIGMVWEFINPHVAVTLDIAPEDNAGNLKIKLAGKPIDIKDANVITVHNGSQFSLDLSHFDRKIRQLNVDVERLTEDLEGTKNEIKQMKAQQVKTEISTSANNKDEGL